MATPYELLVRFNRDGSVSGALTRSIETIGDREFELDPVPLAESDEAFKRFSEQFAAAAVAERDRLKTEVATISASVDGLQSQVTALTTARDQLTTERDQIMAEKSALQTQITEANVKIADLEAMAITLRANQRFNPRVITSDAFFERITKRELSLMAASSDPNVIAIGSLLNQYDDHDWRVELDSEDLIQPLNYLIAVGMLSEERAFELRRDGVESEAYRDQ